MSKFASPFMAKSPLNVELTNREKRKAKKAGIAGAKAEKEGISEKKKERLIKKANKKFMKAADKKTYASKELDGSVGLSGEKALKASKISGEAYDKQKKEQK